MRISLELDDRTVLLVEESARQANQTPTDYLVKMISSIFTRSSAYIVLQPAPSAEQLENIKTAIMNVMKLRVQDGVSPHS